MALGDATGKEARPAALRDAHPRVNGEFIFAPQIDGQQGGAVRVFESGGVSATPNPSADSMTSVAVTVTTGHVDDDPQDETITGAWNSSEPRVKVFDYDVDDFELKLKHSWLTAAWLVKGGKRAEKEKRSPKATLRSGYGKEVRVSGVLTDADGSPLANRRVALRLRNDQHGFRDIASTVTDGAGRHSFKAKPREAGTVKAFLEDPDVSREAQRRVQLHPSLQEDDARDDPLPRIRSHIRERVPVLVRRFAETTGHGDLTAVSASSPAPRPRGRRSRRLAPFGDRR